MERFANGTASPPSCRVPRRSIRTGPNTSAVIGSATIAKAIAALSGRRHAEPVQDFPHPEEERIHQPGMRQLCAEAAMYRGAAAGHRARFLRGCAGGDAPPGDGRPGMDEAPPGNRRTSVWDDEVADGPPSIPGQGIDKSQSRTGLGGAE